MKCVVEKGIELSKTIMVSRFAQNQFFVQSRSGLPHIVSIVNGVIKCDEKCLKGKFCSHAVAVAHHENIMFEHAKALSLQSDTLTKVASTNIDNSVGRKSQKPTRKRNRRVESHSPSRTFRPIIVQNPPRRPLTTTNVLSSPARNNANVWQPWQTSTPTTTSNADVQTISQAFHVSATYYGNITRVATRTDMY